jgi:hypothetical protein
MGDLNRLAGTQGWNLNLRKAGFTFRTMLR